MSGHPGDIPPPPAGAAPPVRRAPRWMQAALLASLGLNLAFLGLAAGLALNAGGPDRAERSPREGVVPLVRALPPEDRRALGREIRQALAAQSGAPAQRAWFDAMLEALRTEPFDAAGFAALLEGQSEIARARIAAGQAALVDHLAAAGPAARRAYADRLEEGLARRGEPD